LVPQAEVPVAAGLLAAGLLAAGLLAAGLLAAGLLAAGVLEVVLVLLLHAARTPIASAATAAPASRERRCSDSFMGSAFSWLTAKFLPNGSGAIPTGKARYPRRPAEEHVVQTETVRLCTAFALRAM
jgi:hypothetical protein